MKKLNNLVVVYSPDKGFSTKEEYLSRYPGDDVVDILAVDNYRDLKVENGLGDAVKKLHIVIDAANEKNKLAAFAETGLEDSPDPLWFTQKPGKLLDDPKISTELSYFMFWRNDENDHFYFSYTGHPSEPDAKRFCQKKSVWLLDDLNKFEKR